MTYELAKKLKDAGFPFVELKPGMHSCHQRETEIIDLCPNFDASKVDPFDTQCHFFVPTLSEFIEICGVDFNRLVVIWIKDGLESKARGAWIIYSVNQFGELEIGGFDSPEEAIANLWLEIQEEKKSGRVSPLRK